MLNTAHAPDCFTLLSCFANTCTDYALMHDSPTAASCAVHVVHMPAIGEGTCELGWPSGT